MRVKIVLFFYCLVVSGLACAVGENAPNKTANNPGLALCNTELVPKDPTSKYIEALQCLDEVILSLQTQVDGLKVTLAQTRADAASAQAAAAEGAAKAAAAEAAANRAAQYAQDTNSKLDLMFKKSLKQ